MMKKFHSNENSGLDINALKQALTQHIGWQNAEFFAMAIHNKQGEYLEETSRFSRLVDWCDNEIRQAGIVLNVFSPADKTKDYTQANFNLWRENIHIIAELLYFRELLVDSRATTEQRNNIEYTICKLYGIHYNEELGGYV